MSRIRLAPAAALAAAAAVAAPGAPAAAAPALSSQRDPHPGIRYELWVDAAVPARIHLVRIDLTSQEIALYATKEADRGRTTRQLSDLLDAQVAINGDAFAVAGYVPRGLAIGDATPWSNTSDDEHTALLHLRRVGEPAIGHERTLAAISTPEIIATPATLPDGTQGAIGGRPLLVRNGAVEAQFDCNDPVTLACTRAPRSAAALSADGNTLWLATVDGWQAGSLGLTAAELAAFLRGRGAHAALALDGGSSASLVLDGVVVSTPSDGVERPVANHLAIKYGALPAGSLVGLICRDDVFACRDDVTLRLPGATVTLDDGRVRTSDANGFYSFTGITPRLACVTVKLAGYKTRVQCQTVGAGLQTYNSVALTMGVDPPDAGAPADAPPAEPLPDGGTGPRPDGGGGFTEPGPGGCCEAGRIRAGRRARGHRGRRGFEPAPPPRYKRLVDAGPHAASDR